MDLLLARAFFVAFITAILAFKVWSEIADGRREREEAKRTLRRPDYAKIARMERELGIATDRTTEK